MLGASMTTLQSAATTNGNGSTLDLTNIGANCRVYLFVEESAGGTCTLTLTGATDGAFTNAYAPGYQRVDNQATLTRAVAAISVTASLKAVYQILDFYPQLRAAISSSSSQNLTVRAWVVPS